jgi:hypothetical protein
MKKIILLLLITVFANAQDIPKLKLKPEGVEPLVFTTEGIKASELYMRSLNWIQETYKNPDFVLKAKIENEKIRFEGLAKDAWWYKLMGMKMIYDMKYVVEISFKDGKYKIDYYVGDFYLSSGKGVAIDYQDFFKKTGEPRSVYGEAIPTLEDTINNLSLSFYNYVTGVTKKQNDW